MVKRSEWDTDSYDAIHRRLQRRRGRAAEHICIDCDQPAQHWSWNRTGPSRAGVRAGSAITWGTDITDYSPRCLRHSLIRDRGGTLTEYPCGHPRTPENTRGGHCRVCYRIIDARLHRAGRRRT